MRFVSAEQFIEKLGCRVYPITLIKFMLNKRRILRYISAAAGDDFKAASYQVGPEGCEVCESKKEQNILCRQHTSIHRVLNTDTVAFDLDTNLYFYKNEIFRMVGNRLVIVYCPHTKLIMGELTDDKVRKVIPITVEDPKLTSLPQYANVKKFISTELMYNHMKCWFDREFSIVTLPDNGGSSNWCLITNR